MKKIDYRYLFSMRSRLIINLEADFVRDLSALFTPLSFRSRLIYFCLIALSRFRCVNTNFPVADTKDFKDFGSAFAGHTVKCIYTGRYGKGNTYTFLTETGDESWITKVFPKDKSSAAYKELVSKDYAASYPVCIKDFNFRILVSEVCSEGDNVMLRSVFYKKSGPIFSDEDYSRVSAFLKCVSQEDCDRSIKLNDLVNELGGNFDNYFSKVPDSLKSEDISLSLQHGDLAPWNVKKLLCGGLLLLDWEEAGFLPKYFDFVYFELRKNKIVFDFENLQSGIRDTLKQFSLDDQNREALVVSHLYILAQKGFIHVH